MNRKKLKQIEECANQLLTRYNLYSIPVDVESLTAALHLDIVEHDLNQEISGLLITAANKSTIGINSNNSPTRRRFTIAHEVGHYVLCHQREGIFIDKPDNLYTIIYRDQNSSTGEYLQEREANAFAAALLMPKELIHSCLKNTKFDFEDPNLDVISRLAEKFEVSNQAMGFRLSNLNLLW